MVPSNMNIQGLLKLNMFVGTWAHKWLLESKGLSNLQIRSVAGFREEVGSRYQSGELS